MIVFLAALPVGTYGENTVLLELGNGTLDLPQRVPGSLSDVVLAGGAPPSILLAVLTDQ
jgi:hypothetical protein